MDKDSLPTDNPIYITRSTSVLASIVACLILIAGILSAIAILTSGPGIMTSVISLSIIARMIYGIMRTQQKIEVAVLTDRLVIKYLQKPFFDSVHDREILFTDIMSYKLATFNGNFFTLYIKDGSKFKITLGPLNKTGGFTHITYNIISIIENNNKTGAGPVIVQKESIYE